MMVMHSTKIFQFLFVKQAKYFGEDMICNTIYEQTDDGLKLYLFDELIQPIFLSIKRKKMYNNRSVEKV